MKSLKVLQRSVFNNRYQRRAGTAMNGVGNHSCQIVYAPRRFNKQSATANLYDILMVSNHNSKRNCYSGIVRVPMRKNSTSKLSDPEYIKIRL